MDQSPKPVVIVAEDNNVIRRMLMVQLEQLGFQPVACADGAVAAEEMKLHPEAVALWTDDDMPHKTGMELVAELRRIREHIRVILASSNANHPEFRLAAEEAGADKIVSKPYSLQQIQEALSGLLPDKTPVEHSRKYIPPEEHVPDPAKPRQERVHRSGEEQKHQPGRNF